MRDFIATSELKTETAMQHFNPFNSAAARRSPVLFGVTWRAGIALFFVLCTHTRAQQKDAAAKMITRLKDQTDSVALYVSPNRRTFKMQLLNDQAGGISRDVMGRCEEDTFGGSDRRLAKTSFPKTRPDTIASLKALLDSLPPDSLMRTKLNSKSKRIAVESRNVRLAGNLFLFAFKRETDNDYHLIIGDDPNGSVATLMNVEISGMPHSRNRVLKNVRQYF